MRNGWEMVRLAEVSTRTIGRTPPRKEARYWTADPSERPFCTIADMRGRFVSGGSEGVTDLAEREGKAKRVPAGSLLLSFKLSIGKVGFTDRDVFPNEAIAWIQPSPMITQPFLALALESVDWDSLGGRAVKGKTLNSGSLDAVQLPLPPLVEQRRLVDLIGAIDDVIEEARAAHDSLLAVVESVRDHDIWRKTTEVRLAEICSIDGVMVNPTQDEYADLPHLGGERIVSGTGDLVGVQTAAEDGVTSGKYLFGPEHIVYSKIRPNLRKVVRPGMRGLCSADAYPILPARGVHPAFLQHLLLSQEFTRRVTSMSTRTKMPKVNRTELMSVLVPSASADEQERIGSVLSVLDDARRETKAYEDEVRSLRETVFAHLLSGEHEIPESYDELIEEVA